MRRTIRLSLAFGGLLLFAGCGSSPAGPDAGPPAPAVPQFGFAWTGTYAVLSCTDSGDGAGVCASAPVGAIGAYSLTLSQSGTLVTGPFTIGTLAFASTGGTIAADGSLSLRQSNQANGITDTAQWTLTVSAGQLHGTFQATSSTSTGAFTLTGQIATAAHP